MAQVDPMNRFLLAIRDYVAQYGNPIQLAAGECMTLIDRTDLWEGNAHWVWRWAIAADGREGWVPAELVEQIAPGAGVARRAYDARELSVKTGDRVASLLAIGGWHLCRTADDRTGWVPGSHLQDQ